MDKYGKPAVLKELTTKRNGVASNGTEGLNATAKDLKGFVESVRSNGGYYLARYEASCEAIQGKTGIEYKLVSKVSKVKVMNYSFVKPEVGQIKLWNGIKQIDAALASREMYNDADRTIGVKSDLANSYAWDTAIVYIQKMGNANYANADRGSNTDLMNTGETGDVKCNIYDMAGNALEWTTEYSTGTDRWYAYTCVYRGGYCKSSDYRAAHRYGTNADNAHWCFSFRPTLYVK